MRELKFRTFDYADNKMREISLLSLDPEVIKDEAIMQYTGRKDVNGKEVYEDDIIRVENLGYNPSNGETPYLLLRVTYSELESAFMAARSDFLSEYADMDIQVIGNAHEHPELL